MRWVGAINAIVGSIAIIASLLSGLIFALQATPDVKRYAIYGIILFGVGFAGILSGFLLVQKKPARISTLVFGGGVIAYLCAFSIYQESVPPRLILLGCYGLLVILLSFRHQAPGPFELNQRA